MPTTAVATIPAVSSPVTPAPIATIDSPERDDDDQAVALGEVLGHELPALRAEEVRAAEVDHDRDEPGDPLKRAVQE